MQIFYTQLTRIIQIYFKHIYKTSVTILKGIGTMYTRPKQSWLDAINPDKCIHRCHGLLVTSNKLEESDDILVEPLLPAEYDNIDKV